MKRAIYTALVMLWAFTMLLICPNGYADSSEPLHLYLDIPFDTATPELVTATLSEKKGVTFEINPNVWSGRAQNISEFGYSFNLQFDFEENYRGTNRILLSSSQPASIPIEDNERIVSDLQQFIDIENQLIELYGEPDCRHFLTSTENGDRKKYMFAEGYWLFEKMKGIYDTNGYLNALSTWKNVCLQVWLDTRRPTLSGKITSRVMLYYYPSAASSTTNSDIEIYPYTP